MAIDNIAQLSLPQVRPAGAKSAAPATARQELPGSGETVPSAASADVQNAVSRMNDYVQDLQRDLHFRVDQGSDRVVVTVVDSESGSVIRQIPSEEMLAVAQRLEQMQGLLLNERA